MVSTWLGTRDAWDMFDARVSILLLWQWACSLRLRLHPPHPPPRTMQPASRPASTSTRPTASPHPNPPFQVNTQTKVFDTAHGRLLCIADIRGRLSALNDLAREANAFAIIHTGDFGFFGACPALYVSFDTVR